MKIFLIAKREFIAVVATRAFVIGLFILPAIIGIFALLAPRLFSNRNYQLKGEVLLIDPTGQVAPELQKSFDPAVIAAHQKEEVRKALANTPQQVQQLAGDSVKQDMQNRYGSIPDLHLVVQPPGSDVEKGKKWLNEQPKEMPHLALIVIHRNAIEPASDGSGYGSYDFYVPPKVDDRGMAGIQQAMREALINARTKARALDKATIEAITGVPNVKSVTITQNEQRQTVQGFNILLPAAFGFLLLMGVMGGGGQLLNSMVEEKSSRVVEVLLSAVSPMELMAGKLIGQLAVSMVGMGLYIVLGISLLAGFALVGLFNFSLIFYLIIFFVLTYFAMGSLMMMVGAVVNDVKEAQSLMMPLTIFFIVPWVLWMPISRDPNSALAVILSFVPIMNSFAILLRMASNTPPPMWQVWLSILVGIGSAYGAVWFAAKVFRIGLLMFGKPPNFATLIRWVRKA
jgi:ABC-2 type transport system permease protein